MSCERPWAPPPCPGRPRETQSPLACPEPAVGGVSPTLGLPAHRCDSPTQCAPTSGLGPLQVVPLRAVGSNPQGGRSHCPSPLPSPSVWPCQPHPTCPGALPWRSLLTWTTSTPASSLFSNEWQRDVETLLLPVMAPLPLASASAPAPGHQASLLCHLPAPSGRLVPAQGLSSGPIHGHTRHSASSHCSQH